MIRFKIFAQMSGLMAAMTIGAGLFALPYVFRESGWLIGLFYLFALSGIVIAAHILYFRVLAETEGGEGGRRLVGLAGRYLGRSGFGLGLIAVTGGLLFTLVVYLILGGQFMSLVFPGLNPQIGTALFWILSSLPFLFAEARFTRLEFLGVILMTAIIALIYFSARNYAALFSAPAVNSANILLPFSAILFSLAAWPVLEPIYKFWRSSSAKKDGGRPMLAIALGTLFAAILYFAFVLGIFGSTGTIAEDTVSGLAGWPDWKIGMLGVLGLFAIWTSYVPIGFEISNSLTGELKPEPISKIHSGRVARDFLRSARRDEEAVAYATATRSNEAEQENLRNPSGYGKSAPSRRRFGLGVSKDTPSSSLLVPSTDLPISRPKVFLRWVLKRASLAAVLFLPPLLIVLGLNNFLRAVGLAGGVFLSLQYLLIVLVSQKALNLRGLKKFFTGFIALLFLLAAVYETYHFVIQ